MNLHRLSSAALLLLAGCCLISSPTQDPGTIQTLSELKPAVEKVYKSFKTATVDEIGVKSIRNQFDHLQGREDAKSCNEIQSGQIKKCREMFDGHVKQRETGGKWSQANYENNLENMVEALDLAVATEKNKSP